METERPRVLWEIGLYSSFRGSDSREWQIKAGRTELR